jgi:hypothetical protein
VPLLEPEELFQQAHALLGQPSQANLRRAISAAYYGLFHEIARAAADMVVGEDARATDRYDWVYRNVQHTRLRELCRGEARVRWGDDFRKFAEGVVQLQQAREDADYSSVITVSGTDAAAKVVAAQNEVARFKSIAAEVRVQFLTRLLFKPRKSPYPDGALSG